MLIIDQRTSCYPRENDFVDLLMCSSKAGEKLSQKIKFKRPAISLYTINYAIATHQRTQANPFNSFSCVLVSNKFLLNTAVA
jgi:hypothetical protein